jgi:hypothetical protein
MLTFITAVRHPHNSVSYERVSRLLDATLHSVCRQTDPEFCVVVVCNELPSITIDDPRVQFVTTDFPPPSDQTGGAVDFNDGVIDKGSKLVLGVAAARVHNPDHVMFFDCDDLVHHGLAEFVNRSPTTAGWYSPSGYLHTVGTRFVQPMTTDFHLKCGSCDILRTDLIPVPSDLSISSSKETVIDSVGADTLYRLFATHGHWPEYLATSGMHLDPLPLPAAIWMIGTGENASGNLVSSRARIPIGPEISDAFGLTAPSRFRSAVRRLELIAQRVAQRVGR